jgi:hypothetical protein
LNHILILNPLFFNARRRAFFRRAVFPRPRAGLERSGASRAQFSAPALSVAENAGSALLEVTRTGDLTREAKVEYFTGDFSADERSDYTTARGTLTFAPGESRKTVTVLLTDDAHVEQDEQLNVSLANPGEGCALGETASVMLTVVDNDTAASSENPLGDPQFFIRHHYHDFLNREPDEGGLAFWSRQLAECGTDVRCIEDKRVNVSAAFFLSIEFQQTG